MDQASTLIGILTAIPVDQRFATINNLAASMYPAAASAAPGTGLLQIVNFFQAEGIELSRDVYDLILPAMPGIFGDYPNPTDKGPSALFVALFAILVLVYLYYFLKGWSRGHRYWPYFGLIWYSIMRTIGMGLRVKWSENLLQVNLGVASVVFNFLPELALLVLNMILAHRLFTWRHPETGNSKAFNFSINLIYILVIGVIVMGIVGEALPYVKFMSAQELHRCNQVMQAAAVLNLLYALSGFLLISLSIMFKPGTIDHRIFRMPKMEIKDTLPPVVQPSWIDSTGLFWFPQKGSQIRTYSDTDAGRAIRVIATNTAPANGLARVLSPENPNGPRYTTDVLIVLITTAILSMNTAFRVASTFYLEPRGGGQPNGPGTPVDSMTVFVYRNYPFYIWYCAFEWLVSIIYIATRVDLRFYLADMPRRGGAEQVESAQFQKEKSPIDANSVSSAAGLHAAAQQAPVSIPAEEQPNHQQEPDFDVTTGAAGEYRQAV